MKRCPLCDFIYEDHQNLCDMDGIELVQDRGVLIPAGKDITHQSSASARSPRRRRTLHLLLGIGLGASILSAYYTSVDQAATAGSQTPVSYAGRSAPAVVEAPPGPGASPPATLPVEPTVATSVVAPPSAPAREPRVARSSEKKPRPEGKNKKKESKLDSFLHKTGRILKKPFRF